MGGSNRWHRTRVGPQVPTLIQGGHLYKDGGTHPARPSTCAVRGMCYGSVHVQSIALEGGGSGHSLASDTSPS